MKVFFERGRGFEVRKGKEGVLTAFFYWENGFGKVIRVIDGN